MDRRLPEPSAASARPTRRNLKLSAADGGCFGGMVACGETYLPAFALALGLSEMAAALAASVPVLCGGLMQLISPWALEKVGGPKRWIVVCATVQALSFVPLIYAAMIGSLPLAALLVIASVYWASGMATGPAWNTWMEDIVPSRLRTDYFPRRTRVQLISTFAVLIASGLFLQFAEDRGHAMMAFAVLFSLAAVLRLISVGLLASHQTPEPRWPAPKRSMPAPSSVGTSPYRLITFLVMVQASVQLSGPFFAPYMLVQLQFGYGQYMLLVSLAFVSKVIALRFLGRLAKRFGAMTLLVVGSIGLVPLSAMWIVSQDMVYLCVIQLISGVVWAAYELGFFLLFFEAMPVAQRTRLLSYYNFANSVALVCGASLGAVLLSQFGCTPEVYFWLFGLSSAGRLACLPVLLGTSFSKKTTIRGMTLRALSLRPAGGSLDVPVLPSIQRGD